MAVTARRNTSDPSITILVSGPADPGRTVPSFGTQRMSAIVPSTPNTDPRTPVSRSVACITTAPAPSPNRMQVPRSV